MKYFRLLFVAIVFIAGVALITLTSLYFYRNQKKKILTPAERKRQHVPGSFIALKAGITHYQLAGPDTGQVVVLIHGFSVPYYIWDSTFSFLEHNGFRVLRYDQYGRGYSDRPDSIYNQTLYFDQLKQLLAALHITNPVILCGVSFGGRMVTNFTSQYPDLVKKVVLVDPGYEDMKPDKPEFIVRYYESTHPNERAMGQLNDFKYPERYPDWVNKYRVQMQYKGFMNAIISTLFNYNCDGRQSYTRLNTKHKPVLLIWGRDDKTNPYNNSDSIRSVLKTDFFPVDDAAHLPHIEQADKVNSKILEFLKKP